MSAYPDVPSPGRLHGAQAPSPVLTLVFRSSLGELRFFETITTFSMPRDAALEELRIESGAAPDPEHRGAMNPLRAVMRMRDADHFTCEYYERDAGKETLAVRLEYARLK